jgi:hypothetical protein
MPRVDFWHIYYNYCILLVPKTKLSYKDVDVSLFEVWIDCSVDIRPEVEVDVQATITTMNCREVLIILASWAWKMNQSPLKLVKSKGQ